MQKNIRLEALRGGAAWIVVFYHFLLAFAPETLGFRTASPQATLVGSPLLALVNGKAAVAFFFVLSGYVLTLRFLATGDRDYLRHAIVKRWPRLAGTAGLVTAGSGALFALGAYRHEAAAALTESRWLSSFGLAKFPAGFEPSMADAALQGGVLTFFLGQTWYNTSLWTMRYELVGSYLSWAMALAAVWLLRGRARPIGLALMAALAGVVSPLFTAFGVGVVLASCAAARVQAPRPPRPGPARWLIAPAGLAVALWCFGYHEPKGAYTLLAGVPIGIETLRTSLYIAGSILLILIATRIDLGVLLKGRLARWLGRMSFPVYLVHPLVLFSLSSALYADLLPPYGRELATLATLAVTVVAVAVLSVPLTWFDEAWTRAVDQAARSGRQWLRRVRTAWRSPTARAAGRPMSPGAATGPAPMGSRGRQLPVRPT